MLLMAWKVKRIACDGKSTAEAAHWGEKCDLRCCEQVEVRQRHHKLLMFTYHSACLLMHSLHDVSNSQAKHKLQCIYQAVADTQQLQFVKRQWQELENTPWLDEEQQ